MKVDGEHADDEQHVEQLARQRGGDACSVVIMFLQLPYVGVNDEELLLVYDLSLIHDFLSRLHHSTGIRHATSQLIEARLAALMVVDEVGHEIVIEVQLCEQLGIIGQLGRSHQCLVGLHGSVHVGDVDTRGLPVVYTAQHEHGVAIDGQRLKRV